MTTVIPHTRDDGQALLVISGDVDMAQADDVKAAGLKLLAGSPHRILLDMLDVTFIDSVGLSSLIVLRNIALAQGAELALLDPSPRVIRILDLTGLATVFPVEHTALSELSST